ncbi:hypothetical protein GC207_11275 [bacterium]|nr:hypothetical protein [bacterium]
MSERGNQSELVTAAQIARAMRASERVMRRRLAHVAPDFDGGGRRAWLFGSLPFALQQELQTESQRQQFSSPVQLLTFDHAANAWSPKVAMSDCTEEAVMQATRLRRALVRAIARRDDTTFSGSELVAMGREDYQREFGHPITDRYWRELFQRTLDRAGNSWPLDAIEIYLPERPARKQPARRATNSRPPSDSWGALARVIDGLNSPLQISADEKELLLTHACEWCQAQFDRGITQKAAREKLFAFLMAQAPGLAANRNALRVTFDRAWRRYQAGEELRDKRPSANAARAKVLNTEELERIVYTSLRKFRGRVAPAVREVKGGKLGARKSYVPETLRREVTPAIAAIAPFHQGPRAADKASPPMDLSYDGIRPMDCLVIDDATWNLYLRWPLPDGSWKLTRGQIILIIDLRTLRVLHFGIIPEEQPNSLLAFTVTAKAIEEFGIPKAIYLERGKVFAESKLMTGGKQTMQAMRAPGWDDIPSAERELGLQRLGVRIITARRARSKPVELVIGLLQNLTDGELGYCGREERYDRPEALTNLLKEARRGEASALNQFYSIEEWADRFAVHVATYNATPQEGKHLRGLSPEEAFNKWWPKNDIVKLDARCRHWLAHHRKPVVIRGGAVSFNLRGEKFTYRHEDLSPMEGRRMLAWIDPELPDVLVVTDMKQENPIAIERCRQPNALAVLLDEPDATFADETAKVQRHQRYWAGVHRTLKSKHELSFRVNLVDRKVVALGAEIERQRTDTVRRREDKERREHQGRTRLNKLGLSSATVSRSADIDSGSANLAELLRRAKEEEGETA